MTLKEKITERLWQLIRELYKYESGNIDEVVDDIGALLSPQWVSVEEFEKEANEGWCWLVCKGRVVKAYHDHNGLYRFHIGSQNVYQRECITYAQPINPPQPPKEGE